MGNFTNTVLKYTWLALSAISLGLFIVDMPKKGFKETYLLLLIAVFSFIFFILRHFYHKK